MPPTRRKKPSEGEELSPKKKTTGKRGKSERPQDVDNELFTKGPFSGTQIIADDLGPDIHAGAARKTKPRTPSARRDTRKQAAPVSAKVLEFKRPTGKVALTEGVTVKELADKLGIKANDLMKHLLMKKGLMVSINQPLGADLALEIAKDLDIDAEMVSFEEAVELRGDGEDARQPARRRAARSSPSWATSTTARPRCSTPSARPTSPQARPAASPSTSAPITSRSTAGRSSSSTRRATRPSR